MSTPPTQISLISGLLGAIALAGVPLSAWLFVDSYVDAAIARALAQADKDITRTTDQLQREVDQVDREHELLRAYAQNLCSGVRAATLPPLLFECGSTYYRAR